MRTPIGLSRRFRVLERCQFRCHYCGADARTRPLEVDHIIPVARGGTDDDINLVAACFDCNRGKRDRLLAGTTFSDWIRLQRNRDDLVGDIADDEVRMPLGDIRTYAELRAAMLYVGARYEARVAATHAWREYRRGKPTAIVREQQDEHARLMANTPPGVCYWSKQGTFVDGKRL